MAVRVTPDEFVSNHATGLANATEKITKGVNAVTEAPGVKAAAAKDKMRAKLLAKIDDGTWEKNTRAVSVADWKSKMINKGIPAISTGVTEAADKIRNFASQLLPAVEKAQASIATMPSTTLDQNIARMTKYVREMATFKKK